MSLLDDVGIVQHARGVIPNRSSGYCVDDVARLSIVALGLQRACGDPSYRQIVATGLAFLFHAWDRHAAGMRNFMSYERRWLDDPHPGDHVGRAVWALGAVVADDPTGGEAAACRGVLAELETCLRAVRTPREAAFAILGLTRPETSALPVGSGHLLAELAGDLAGWFDRHQRPGWTWFEHAMTYDNARLPQALIAAGSRLDDPSLARRGLAALDWYAQQCGIGTGTVRLVGNGWRRAGEPRRRREDEGDEQPLDAAALVEALLAAATYTGDRTYAQRAADAFEWFLGRNSYGVALYDPVSGGCRDGVGPHGLNENQGAESTLAFLQARLALAEAGLPAMVGSHR